MVLVLSEDETVEQYLEQPQVRHVEITEANEVLRYDSQQRRLCNRMSKRSQSLCCGPAMHNGCCRMHGGKAIGGIAHPHYKHGRYSRTSGGLRDNYESALADEAKLLDMREDIALLRSMAERAAERLTERDTPDFRRRAMDLFSEARESSDPEKAAARLTELGSLLSRGSQEDRAMRHLTLQVEAVSRRVEAAWKIRLNAAGVATAQDVERSHVQLLNILRDEVHDRDVLARVVERYDQEVLGAGATSRRPTSLPETNGTG